MSGVPQKKIVVMPENATASYWSVRFEKKPAGTELPLRVCWMWGVDGDWQAATNARTDFALHGALYKLYVVRAESQTVNTSSTALEPIQEFLTAFLPEVKKALAAPTGQSE